MAIMVLKLQRRELIASLFSIRVLLVGEPRTRILCDDANVVHSRDCFSVGFLSYFEETGDAHKDERKNPVVWAKQTEQRNTRVEGLEGSFAS